MKEDILKFSQTKIEEKLEEFEIPEKYRGMINTGKMQKKYGDNFPVPDYVTPANNDEIEIP